MCTCATPASTPLHIPTPSPRPILSQIPATLTVGAFFIGLGWLGSLRFLGRFFVWLSLGVVLLVAAYLSYLVTDEVDFQHGLVGWLCVAAVVAYAVVRYHKINQAGRMLEQASLAILENLSIFCFSLPWQLLYLAWLYALTKGAIWLQAHWAVDPGDCSITLDYSKWDQLQRMWVTFMWIAFFFKQVNVYVTAVTLANWTFSAAETDRTDCGIGIVPQAVGWGLTVSLPFIAASSLISTICERLYRAGVRSRQCRLWVSLMRHPKSAPAPL